MGRKRAPGLFKRGKTWHIDKQIFGQRLRESTCTGSLEEAEKYLAHRIEEIRLHVLYGIRPKRKFREAATKFLNENMHKRSIDSDASRLRVLDRYIGEMTLDKLHMGTLQDFIQRRKEEGVKMRTINQGLKMVRQILNLATSEWLDEHGLTWLAFAPKIKLLPEPDLRKPYPLNWAEQRAFFQALPLHLSRMALFAVNTGCRDMEICRLRWDWEVQVPELNTYCFIVPGELVKNGEERLIVLNSIAKSIIEEARGEHDEYVFTYRGNPIKRILNSGWKLAREKTGIPVRVHDLKHTFGRRLRAAGVSYEDRQDLLGHRSGRITTHYSAAELNNLIKAAETVCQTNTNGPTLTLLKRGGQVHPHKIPTMGKSQGSDNVVGITSCV